MSDPTMRSSMPRKAMLLAAGIGSRLRPLTDNIPKCMIKIAGKPVLEHNISLLRSYGVDDLVINLHYFPEYVEHYFGDGSRFGVKITYSLERDLLGTAGAVKRAQQYFEGPFFVWYADNLSTCRLDDLWRFHQSKNAVVTIALYKREDPTGSGIVALDENDGVTRFLEKPGDDEVFSNWVNAGILLLQPTVLDSVPSGAASDFGRDVIPTLIDRGSGVFGYRMSEGEGLWWIDTPSDLARVEQTFDNGYQAINQ